MIFDEFLGSIIVMQVNDVKANVSTHWNKYIIKLRGVHIVGAGPLALIGIFRT